VANDDAYSVDEGNTLTVTAPTGVLLNDPDVENDTLTATLDSTPSHGTLALNPDGSFTYDHDGETPTDSFTYRAYDGTDYSNVATVTITINLFDPVITAITVTSDSPTYFYAPELEDTGGEVFFNSLDGEGGGQTITVTVSFTDAHPHSLEGDGAFNDNPPADTSGPPWTVTYSIGNNAHSEINRVFTATDKAGNTDTAVITFTRDNVDPTVELTDVTPPDYDDGSKWYDPDNLSAGWYFTSTVTDTLSGLALANASWDHSNDIYDQLTYNPGLDGDGVFKDVDDDGDGVVTVTLTITDKVGNSASDLVVFNIDNTKPDISSPTITEGSDYLHANDLTVYYGDEMGMASQAFTVQGNAQDSGVGLDYVSYSAALNQGYSEDSIHLEAWYRDYTAKQSNTTSGVITATIYDRLGNFATQIFTYTRDITSPNISYGSPPIVEDSPYLHADGTTVYYSHQMGGTSQSFTVQGHASDDGAEASGLDRATFSPALGNVSYSSPVEEWSPADEWSRTYNDVEDTDWGNGTITVTVYDNVSNWSTAVFTYIEDTIAPTVTLTYVTPGGYDQSEPDYWLDADGSNWYNAGDFTAGGNGWQFIPNTADDGAGLASCAAFWDHSNNDFDRLPLDCGPDGDDIFPNASSDAEGTVTVTVTITDHVGNPAIATVVFNIDNTKPTITSPHISEDSPHLYRADDLVTVYYGDEMGSAQTFTVNGSSDDTGVGFYRAEFSEAFNNTPSPDNNSTWSRGYYPDNQDWGSGTITVTVYDHLDNAAYENFYYIRDTEPPTVVVNCPALSSQPSWSVAWSGSWDPPPASDVNHFDVQYREESGDWQDWLMDTSLTEATFGPTFPVPVQDNTTYYFRVRAEDNVSNEQQYTNGEDATTYQSGVKTVFLPVVVAPDSNWGFETGDFTSWQHGGELAQSVSTAMPRSGNYSALLGSPSYACNSVPVGSAWLRRSVTVPSSGSPTLSFWYRIYTQDKNTNLTDDYDLFAVYINGSRVWADANTSDPYGCSTLKNLGWQPASVSLNGYQGQTIQITFYNYNRAPNGAQWYNTYTYVDDVSVQ